MQLKNILAKVIKNKYIGILLKQPLLSIVQDKSDRNTKKMAIAFF
ncbi:hypothetical protein [Desmonostoc muscorum]|nr:hypothetical protein [Desmonostoc muscorum]